MARIIPFKLNRNNKNKPLEVPKEQVPTVAERLAHLRAACDAVENLAMQQAAEEHLPSYMDLENMLGEKLDELGRTASELFLTCAHERVAASVKDGKRVGDRILKPAPRLQARNLTGRFGVVRYFRTYLRENYAGRRRGLHPLDLVLGLPADRFSWNVLSLFKRTPKTGPGNKSKRERLEKTQRYLEKRLGQMNYKELRAQDLEIGSGAVEGAVKYVIGRRCDHGGMRWIKERAEALLQLRCLELNGHWDAFIRSVHDKLKVEGALTGRRQRLQTQSPAPLPVVHQAAKAA
jgi:hypothetical protein